MKKLTTILCVTALVLSLLAGCAKEPAPTTPSTEATVPSTEATVPTTEATVPSTEATDPSTEPTEPSTEPSTQPAVTVHRNPLNGTVLDAPFTGRVVAVMHNNISQAMPQVGISQADIHYEVLAEGGITRNILLYSDISKAPTLGTIRSARPYYVQIAASYDAIYVHAGGSDAATNLISYYGLDDIDALNGSATNYFYRDSWRAENKGYEHSLMIDSEDILACAKKLEYPLERPDGVDFGLQFAEDVALDGQDVTSIKVQFSKYGKTTTFKYYGDENLYYARQHGGAYIDGSTNQQLSFTNVLVLVADTALNSDNYTLSIDLVGQGEGWFSCGGKTVAIRWSRDSETGPFVYTLEDGTPVTFGVGRSFVAIVPQYGTVDFE
jgi:hypothetical protein